MKLLNYNILLLSPVGDFKSDRLVETQFMDPKEIRIPLIGVFNFRKSGNVWGDNHQNQIFCSICGAEPIGTDGNIFEVIHQTFVANRNDLTSLKPIWIGCLYRMS